MEVFFWVVSGVKWVSDTYNPLSDILNSVHMSALYHRSYKEIPPLRVTFSLASLVSRRAYINSHVHVLSIPVPATTVSPTTATPSFCVDKPVKDEHAIKACSWLIDTDSPFYVRFSNECSAVR
jgi:hypothetical protein